MSSGEFFSDDFYAPGEPEAFDFAASSAELGYAPHVHPLQSLTDKYLFGKQLNTVRRKEYDIGRLATIECEVTEKGLYLGGGVEAVREEELELVDARLIFSAKTPNGIIPTRSLNLTVNSDRKSHVSTTETAKNGVGAVHTRRVLRPDIRTLLAVTRDHASRRKSASESAISDEIIKYCHASPPIRARGSGVYNTEVVTSVMAIGRCIDYRGTVKAMVYGKPTGEDRVAISRRIDPRMSNNHILETIVERAGNEVRMVSIFADGTASYAEDNYRATNNPPKHDGQPLSADQEKIFGEMLVQYLPH